MNMKIAVQIYNCKFSVLDVLLSVWFTNISSNSLIAALYMGTA